MWAIRTSSCSFCTLKKFITNLKERNLIMNLLFTKWLSLTDYLGPWLRTCKFLPFVYWKFNLNFMIYVITMVKISWFFLPIFSLKIFLLHFFFNLNLLHPIGKNLYLFNFIVDHLSSLIVCLSFSCISFFLSLNRTIKIYNIKIWFQKNNIFSHYHSHILVTNLSISPKIINVN